MSFFQKTVNLKNGLIYIGGTLVAAAIGSFLGSPSFDGLTKPPLTPPQWVFPVVWTVLYLLMGYAAYRVAGKLGDRRNTALSLYWLQLGVNVLWPFFFFRLDWLLFAFFWLLLLIALIVSTIYAFRDIDKLSSRLLYPYLVWCAFASYLNLAFFLINRR